MFQATNQYGYIMIYIYTIHRHHDSTLISHNKTHMDRLKSQVSAVTAGFCTQFASFKPLSDPLAEIQVRWWTSSNFHPFLSLRVWSSRPFPFWWRSVDRNQHGNIYYGCVWSGVHHNWLYLPRLAAMPCQIFLKQRKSWPAWKMKDKTNKDVGQTFI